MNALQELHDTGQSIWLDNIRKDLLTTGTLARYIGDFAVTGVTSNPTILEKAISGSSDYDAAICTQLDLGVTRPEDLVFALAIEDIVAAADLLRPIFDTSSGADGYVSVEVPPDLAHDTDGTVAAGVCDLLEPDEAAADEVFLAVTKAGIDIDGLAADLQDLGAKAFSASWSALLACIASKVKANETASS